MTKREQTELTAVPNPPPRVYGLWCPNARGWLSTYSTGYKTSTLMTFTTLGKARKIAKQEEKQGLILVPALIGVAPPATPTTADH